MNHTPAVAEAVYEVAQQVLGCRLTPAELTTPLRRVGLDSAAMIEFILVLETRFRIRILDQEILPENFRSVSAVVKYIEGKL